MKTHRTSRWMGAASALALLLGTSVASAQAEPTPAPIEPAPPSGGPAAVPSEPTPPPSAPASAPSAPPPESAPPPLVTFPPPVYDAPAEEAPEPTRAPEPFRLEAGLRMMHVGNAGLDPYAENDALAFFSLDATKAFAVGRRVAVAIGAEWNVGGTSAAARGADASLTIHRLGVPLEARYHATHWLYGFARVAPGVTSLSATLRDRNGGREASANGWVFSSDFMAGVSFQVAPLRNPSKRTLRLWLTPEVGYTWSAARTMRFAPEASEDDPRPAGSASLGSLALRGLTYRFTLALAF